MTWSVRVGNKAVPPPSSSSTELVPVHKAAAVKGVQDCSNSSGVNTLSLPAAVYHAAQQRPDVEALPVLLWFVMMGW